MRIIMVYFGIFFAKRMIHLFWDKSNSKRIVVEKKNYWYSYTASPEINKPNDLNQKLAYGERPFGNRLVEQSFWKGDGYGKAYKEGDVVTCIVSKKNKTIEFKVNGISQGIAFRNVHLTSYRVFCSAYNSDVIMELNSPIIEFQPVNLDKIQKEENQRLTYILKNMVDFKVPLKNKTLRLPKNFFINSNIQKLKKMDVYEGIKEISLNVNERNILYIILGEPQKLIIDPLDLLDYYVFFKSIGLKREIMSIITKIRSVKSIKILYDSFKSCCLRCENETIKGWWSNNPECQKEFEFDTSFALSIFNEFKDRENEMKTNINYFLLPNYNIILYQLSTYKERKKLFKHNDFSKTGFSSKGIKDDLEKMFLTKKLNNMILKTKDGGLFKVHKEVLVWKTSFFFRMFRFQGNEMTEMRERGSIALQGFLKKELEILLSFIYLGKLGTGSGNFNSILKLLEHCEMHYEETMKRSLLEKLRESKISKIEMTEMLSNYGYKLQNENLKKLVVPALIEKAVLKDEMILKLIRKSIRKNTTEDEIIGLKKKNLELERIVQDLRKDVKFLKEELSEIKNMITKNQR